MKEPVYLENGTRVRTNTSLGSTTGMNVNPTHLSARTARTEGAVCGVVAGHGGDVYWVRHGDGEGASVAAYCFDEFELAKPAKKKTAEKTNTADKTVWEHMNEDE